MNRESGRKGSPRLQPPKTMCLTNKALRAMSLKATSSKPVKSWIRSSQKPSAKRRNQLISPWSFRKIRWEVSVCRSRIQLHSNSRKCVRPTRSGRFRKQFRSQIHSRCNSNRSLQLKLNLSIAQSRNQIPVKRRSQSAVP